VKHRQRNPRGSPPHRVETPEGFLLRHCHGIEEFEACVRLERAVWKSADIDVVPVPLFVVASETGGQVLGAFRDRVRALLGARQGIGTRPIPPPLVYLFYFLYLLHLLYFWLFPLQYLSADSQPPQRPAIHSTEGK